MRERSTAALALVIIAGVLGVIWGFWVRPLLVAGRQVRTWATIQTYAALVDAYSKEHGTLPHSLQEAVPEDMKQRELWLAARDVYDNPFHYEVRGSHFLIASYGRDGARDDGVYAREEEPHSRTEAPCYDANIDSAYSSDGVRQVCGK